MQVYHIGRCLEHSYLQCAGLILTVLLAASIPAAVFVLREPASNPAEWAQGLSGENLSAVVWDDSKEQRLTDEELQELTTVLNGLQPDAFHENKSLAGITPTFGLRLSIGDKAYNINQADTSAGQMEMGYQGKLWWIQSESLWTERAGSAIGVGTVLINPVGGVSTSST